MTVETLLAAAAVAEKATTSPSTLDDRVRAATTLASITLALLTLFTTRRAQKLADDRASGIGGFSGGTLLAVAPESLLAAATFGALAAMSRLFWDSFSLGHWADRDHVVESLFSLAYLGFVALFLFQVTLVGWRLVVAVRNSLA
jgi:hypothetical protein